MIYRINKIKETENGKLKTAYYLTRYAGRYENGVYYGGEEIAYATKIKYIRDYCKENNIVVEN